jgi:CRP-like cAMP-binding protein
LIIKGIVRGCYFDENGEDVTKSFAKENEFIATKGLLSDQPSLFQVECLEDMECILIPYKVIHKVMEENNDIFVAFNQYVLKAMEELELRTRNLLMKSAKDRYIIFSKQYPDLEHRINLNYIASYIGIKSGSLSRIRKQINSEI